MGFVPQYRREDRLWTVGYYDPSNRFVAIQDCATAELAMEAIHFLNGGNGKATAELIDSINDLAEILDDRKNNTGVIE